MKKQQKVMCGIINTKKISEADVVILGEGYEKTASSRKGTVNGPATIVKCLENKLEFFDRTFKSEPAEHISIAYKNIPNINTLSPEKALAKITGESKKRLGGGAFVFLLGGEHSVSLGLLQALAETTKPEETTILHIDAHSDMRDDDSDYSAKPSRYAHSCVMRRASELGYPIVQVGIRTYSRDEYEYFSNPKNNVTVFEWGLAGKPVSPITNILRAIKTKNVYISIDVDGFDPSVMPGTGTPVQGGLEWWYGIELMTKTIAEKNLVGADIVEVSPMRDSVLTEYGAAQLFYTIIAQKFSNRFTQ